MGCPTVEGFRAPFFRRARGHFGLLRRAGYAYDASMGTVMPGPANALLAALPCPHRRGGLYEFPTSAMAGGMLPLSLGLAGDAALQGQMAIAVIGGLITSTALTLVLVPAGFTLMDDVERWLGRKLGHRIMNASAAQPATTADPV